MSTDKESLKKALEEAKKENELLKAWADTFLNQQIVFANELLRQLQKLNNRLDNVTDNPDGTNTKSNQKT